MKHSAWKSFVDTRNPQAAVPNPRPRRNQGAEPLNDRELKYLHMTALRATQVMGEWPTAHDNDWALIREANPRRLMALLDELRTLRSSQRVERLESALRQIAEMSERSDAYPDLQFGPIARKALAVGSASDD